MRRIVLSLFLLLIPSLLATAQQESAQQRRLRLTPDSYAEFPVLVFVADDTTVDLTIFSRDALRQPPLDRIDGKPMQRATRTQVLALLDPDQRLSSGT